MLITLNYIFAAWDQFLVGKKQRTDVLFFQRFLEDNLFALFRSLEDKTYTHGKYEEFYVRDPKIRHIHKAQVQDRIVHHLVSKVLEKIFDKTFYAHSYSCRQNRGTHKAVETFINFARQASHNNSSPLYILKCDVKKFFASIDQSVLLSLLKKRITDPDFLWLLEEIISSFKSEQTLGPLFPKGMPIGNLTSQIFANIYMDPFDQFMKHTLKIKHYIRYADDFVVISSSKQDLENLIPQISDFLDSTLSLILHPNKVSIRSYYLGIDFLGYVIFPRFILPRTKTKRRLFRKIYKQIQLANSHLIFPESVKQTINSYLGYLSHAHSYKLSQQIKNQVWFWTSDEQYQQVLAC